MSEYIHCRQCGEPVEHRWMHYVAGVGEVCNSCYARIALGAFADREADG